MQVRNSYFFIAMIFAAGCNVGGANGGTGGGGVSEGGAFFGQPIATNLPTQSSGSSTVNEVALGDFDGDGKLDAVVTSNSGGVFYQVLHGKGDGTFTPLAADSYFGYGPAVADFNGDGKLDFLIGSSGVDVLQNTDKGTGFDDVHTNVMSQLGITGVLAVDMTGDGRPDPVVSTNPYVAVVVNGSGQIQYTSVELPSALAAADLDGDKKMDLVVLNADAQTPVVTVFKGNGNGSLTLGMEYPVAMQSTFALGDLDGDGHADLLVPGAAAGLQVLLGRGDGTFHMGQTFASGTQGGVGALQLADVDGDKRLDALTLDANGKLLTVLLGRGDGTFAQPSLFGVTTPARVLPTTLAVGDVDGDGLPDAVVASDQQLFVLHNETLQ